MSHGWHAAHDFAGSGYFESFVNDFSGFILNFGSHIIS